MKKERRQSIENVMNFTTNLLLAILLIPALVSLIMLAVYMLSIHQSTYAISRIAAAYTTRSRE